MQKPFPQDARCALHLLTAVQRCDGAWPQLYLIIMMSVCSTPRAQVPEPQACKSLGSSWLQGLLVCASASHHRLYLSLSQSFGAGWWVVTQRLHLPGCSSAGPAGHSSPCIKGSHGSSSGSGSNRQQTMIYLHRFYCPAVGSLRATEGMLRWSSDHACGSAVPLQHTPNHCRQERQEGLFHS